MATFKVGQRVRLIAYAAPGDGSGRPGTVVPLGSEGTVLQVTIPGFEYCGDSIVAFDNCPPASLVWGGHACFFYMLAPAVDPKAAQFIERIKKLAREPAPALSERAEYAQGTAR